MAHGDSLYAEIFQYTLPGTELVELLLIKMFGAKVALMNAMLFVAGIVDVFVVLNLASSILPTADALLATVLFLYFGIHGGLDATHHTLSIMVSYGAAAVVIRSRTPQRLLIAGTLLGFATSFTQTRALVAVGIAIFLAWESSRTEPGERHLLRDELCLLLPFAAISAMACGYVLWNAGWQRFVRDLVVFPIHHYPFGWGNSWSTAILDLPLSRLAIADWVGVKALVPVAYVAFLFYWWRQSRNGGDARRIEAMFLAAFGLSLFATVAYAPVYIRVAEISAPAIILTLWMLNQRGAGRWRAPVWAGVGILMLVAVGRTQRGPYQFYDSRAGRIAISSPDEFAELNWLGEHTRPGDSLFSAGTPMFYVLLDLRNVSQVPFIEADNYTRADQVEATAQCLRTQRPQFVFWPFTRGEADEPGELLYPLGEELRRNYRRVTEFPDGQVWERNDPQALSNREVGKLAD